MCLNVANETWLSHSHTIDNNCQQQYISIRKKGTKSLLIRSVEWSTFRLLNLVGFPLVNPQVY